MLHGKRDTKRNISCSTVSRFRVHFVLYRGNLDYFLDSEHEELAAGSIHKHLA